MSRHNAFRAAHGVPALTWDPKVEIKKEKSRLAKFTTIYITAVWCKGLSELSCAILE